ncbi:hypothetical protein PTKIN_Ptkin09bG0274900 [Pterospermum kingtungense]
MVTTLQSLAELHLSSSQLPLVGPILNLNSSFLAILDLSGNFGGYPSILSWVYSLKTLVSLDLEDTGLKGPIHNGLGNLTCLRSMDRFQLYQLLILVPSSISILILSMVLEAISLAENHLFGQIPNCWMKWQNLFIIVLSGNNFTGSPPPSLGTLRFLHSLHLANNRLSGELPLQLKDCQQLTTLDLNGNEFKGHIPGWLGLSLQNLIVLSVGSNNFHGSIPNELCTHGSLQVLDLSHNNLSGYLPKCLGNSNTMFKRDYSILEGLTSTYYHVRFFDYAFLVMKGKKVEYSRTLSFVKSIDLSDNNFHGEIPSEITRLQRLQSLNLSHNYLIGSFPASIVAMTSLRGFDASSFTGNRLCGPPVTENCSVNCEIPDTRNEDRKNHANGLEVDWFYVIMAIGFATGFGAILVPLMLSWWWRWLYFQFLDQMWTRLVLLYARAAT